MLKVNKLITEVKNATFPLFITRLYQFLWSVTEEENIIRIKTGRDTPIFCVYFPFLSVFGICTDFKVNTTKNLAQRPARLLKSRWTEL